MNPNANANAYLGKLRLPLISHCCSNNYMSWLRIVISAWILLLVTTLRGRVSHQT